VGRICGSPCGYEKPSNGLVAAEWPARKKFAGAREIGVALDPPPPVPPGLRLWTRTRWTTTAEMSDTAAQRGVVGGRGIYAGEAMAAYWRGEKSSAELGREGGRGSGEVQGDCSGSPLSPPLSRFVGGRRRVAARAARARSAMEETTARERERGIGPGGPVVGALCT
jgi:hypothetical protein